MPEFDDEEWVCACGAKAKAGAREKWRYTDAPWCPRCAWLA
jgi:hypothetical protein